MIQASPFSLRCTSAWDDERRPSRGICRPSSLAATPSRHRGWGTCGVPTNPSWRSRGAVGRRDSRWKMADRNVLRTERAFGSSICNRHKGRGTGLHLCLGWKSNPIPLTGSSGCTKQGLGVPAQSLQGFRTSSRVGPPPGSGTGKATHRKWDFSLTIPRGNLAYVLVLSSFLTGQPPTRREQSKLLSVCFLLLQVLVLGGALQS